MSCGQRTTLYFLTFERGGLTLGSCCVFGCCFPSAVIEAGNKGLAPKLERGVRFEAVGRRIFPPLVGLVPPELVGVPLTDEQARRVDWEGIKEAVCS